MPYTLPWELTRAMRSIASVRWMTVQQTEHGSITATGKSVHCSACCRPPGELNSRTHSNAMRKVNAAQLDKMPATPRLVEFAAQDDLF
jgi:hypothetical protein